MNIAVAAHPDDIEFGMGATLSQLQHVACIVSFQCNDERKKEVVASLRILGVDPTNIYFTSSSEPRGLVAEYDILLSKLNPVRVFTHFSGDSHQEHAIVHQCALAALRRFPKTTCLVWENNQPGSMTMESFSPRVFVPVTPDSINKKLDALRQHYSQMKKYDTSSLFTFLTDKARSNGFLCGSHYAEAFFPIKLVLEL